MIPSSLSWISAVSLASVVSASGARYYSEAIDNGTYGSYPVRTYVTEESLTSPRINWLKWSPECDDGRLHFITPRGEHLSNPGPMILDNNGDLIWSQHFDNDFGGQAYNLRVQQYQGQDYLTFWLGDDGVRGHGNGVYYMLNSSYDVFRQVNAAGGFEADLHEFLITPQGTALLSVYDIHPFDVTAFRSFDPDDEQDKDPNYIWDCLIQEVSIDTGDLLFQWRVSDHIDLNETYHAISDVGTLESPWDWFHLNSVAKDELGNYLISARYTQSITYLDGETGKILWSLGGKRNNFMDLSGGLALIFAWQHDAGFHALDAFPEIYTPPPEQAGITRRLLTLFDNAAEGPNVDYGAEKSRGLLLELTYPTNSNGYRPAVTTSDIPNGGSGVHKDSEKLAMINGTNPEYAVRLVKSYENPRKLRSSSQGSMQIVSGDGARPKAFVGYGFNAVWTEFDINGTVLCDVHYGAETSWEQGHIQSYRAHKYPWKGSPRVQPKLAISDDGLDVFVSWNGATEVVAWLLQDSKKDSSDDGHWTNIAKVNRDSFETMIALSGVPVAPRRYLRAVALGVNDMVLDYGLSHVLDRSSPFTQQEVSSSGGLTAVVSRRNSALALIIVAIAATGCGYDLLRRWRSWRVGRQAASPIRWKQGLIYRRISGEA